MDALLSNHEACVALVLLALLFVAFVTELYPPEVTAIGGAAAFILLGLVPMNKVISVFSNPAPVTIAAMFVLSGALVRTGVLQAVSESIVTRAEKQPILISAVFIMMTIIAAAFVNNTPVVLVLIPIVLRLAATIKIAPTRVLIPLSYVAILGGTCTLIGTSTNLLVAGVAERKGLEPFSIFEITPVGIVVAVTGIPFMWLIGRFLLPSRGVSGDSNGGESEFLTEVTVRTSGRFTRQIIKKIAAFQRPGIKILGLKTSAGTIRTGIDKQQLKKGDTLIIMTKTSEILTLNEESGLRVGFRRGVEEVMTNKLVVEAVVAPRGVSAGQRIADLTLGRRYGVRVLGVHRHRHIPGPDLDNVRLSPADKLLLEGPSGGFDVLATEADLVSLTRPAGRAYRRRHALVTLFALGQIVFLSAFGLADIGALSLMAVAGILLMRCIDSDEAWSSIDASILVLIWAMLIVSLGLEMTGAVELIVRAVAPALSTLPPFITLLMVYALTSVLTELVTNNAVAVLLTPIAIGVATQMGVNPRPFVIAVMFAASASFATPIGYQTNMLVYSAGNYRFSDFLRMGIPMNIVIGTISVLAITYFFPM